MDDGVAFLFDVDNTLLDNDRLRQDLRDKLAQCCGREAHDRYWALLDEMRASLGYVDYLGALQALRNERLHDPQVMQVSQWLLAYPFAERVYPAALDVLARVRSFASVAILSDGDAVFQPWKIARSGLEDAVGGQVLIYVHKEQMLEDVRRRRPAKHYVMVDDKPRILAAMKSAWGTLLTTVFVRQGHYATEDAAFAAASPADVSIARIGDLLHEDLARLATRGAAPA